jgi:hypothetical protein
MLAKRKGLSRMDFCWCECDRGQWRHRVRTTTVLQLGSQAGTSNFREVPYATWLAISRRELFPIPFFFIPCVTMHPPPPDSSSDIGRYLCRPCFDIHFVAGRLKPLYTRIVPLESLQRHVWYKSVLRTWLIVALWIFRDTSCNH